MISSYQCEGKVGEEKRFSQSSFTRRALLALIVITQGPRLDNALLSSVSIKCTEMQLYGKISAISWFQMFHRKTMEPIMFSCTYVFNINTSESYRGLSGQT